MQLNASIAIVLLGVGALAAGHNASVSTLRDAYACQHPQEQAAAPAGWNLSEGARQITRSPDVATDQQMPTAVAAEEDEIPTNGEAATAGVATEEGSDLRYDDIEADEHQPATATAVRKLDPQELEAAPAAYQLVSELLSSALSDGDIAAAHNALMALNTAAQDASSASVHARAAAGMSKVVFMQLCSNQVWNCRKTLSKGDVEEGSRCHARNSRGASCTAEHAEGRKAAAGSRK